MIPLPVQGLPRPVALFSWTSEEVGQGTIPIYPNDDFFIGRNSQLCRQSWPDATISSKHLRIRCVIFEEDETSGVPPLVYVEDNSTNGTIIEGFGGDSEADDIHDCCLRKGDNAFLLTHGSCVQLSPSVTLRFKTLNQAERDERIDELYRDKLCGMQLFKKRYLVTPKKLGVGGYGVVYLAVDRSNNHQVACKVVDIEAGRKNAFEHQVERSQRIERELREVEVLRDIRHPNIIQLQKVFWNSSYIYIMQELVSGGDLYSYIDRKGGALHDADAAVIVLQVLKALEYLHERNIVHRDVKPDNILLTSPDEGARVILSDFGAARRIPAAGSEDTSSDLKQRMFSVVGTYEYAAPEIHKKNHTIPDDCGYSKAVDMWSVGAITAAALTGDVIFTDRANPNFDRNPGKVVLALASKCNLDAMDQEPQWKGVGRRPKDFIRRLLVLDESKRMTVEEALQHSWFSNKMHATYIDKIYQRAIATWKPERRKFNVVQRLQTRDKVIRKNTSLRSGLLSNQVISNFFQPPEPPKLEDHPAKRARISHSLAGSRKGMHTPLPTISEEAEVASSEESIVHPYHGNVMTHTNVTPMPAASGVDDSFPGMVQVVDARSPTQYSTGVEAQDQPMSPKRSFHDFMSDR